MNWKKCNFLDKDEGLCNLTNSLATTNLCSKEQCIFMKAFKKHKN